MEAELSGGRLHRRTDVSTDPPVVPSRERCLEYLGKRFGWYGGSVISNVEEDLYGRGISFLIAGQTGEQLRLALDDDPNYEFIVEEDDDGSSRLPFCSCRVTMYHRGRSRSLEVFTMVCLLWLAVAAIAVLLFRYRSGP